MTVPLLNARYWLLGNSAGFGLFLYFSSWLWAPWGEEGLVGGPGDDMIGGLTVLPVFLLFALVNLVWLVRICRSRLLPKWPRLLLWVMVVVCWAGGVWYDRLRDFTGKDVIQYVAP